MKNLYFFCLCLALSFTISSCSKDTDIYNKINLESPLMWGELREKEFSHYSDQEFTLNTIDENFLNIYVFHKNINEDFDLVDPDYLSNIIIKNTMSEVNLFADVTETTSLIGDHITNNKIVSRNFLGEFKIELISVEIRKGNTKIIAMFNHDLESSNLVSKQIESVLDSIVLIK